MRPRPFLYGSGGCQLPCFLIIKILITWFQKPIQSCLYDAKILFLQNKLDLSLFQISKHKLIRCHQIRSNLLPKHHSMPSRRRKCHLTKVRSGNLPNSSRVDMKSIKEDHGRQKMKMRQGKSLIIHLCTQKLYTACGRPQGYFVDQGNILLCISGMTY